MFFSLTGGGWGCGVGGWVGEVGANDNARSRLVFLCCVVLCIGRQFQFKLRFLSMSGQGVRVSGEGVCPGV